LHAGAGGVPAGTPSPMTPDLVRAATSADDPAACLSDRMLSSPFIASDSRALDAVKKASSKLELWS